MSPWSGTSTISPAFPTSEIQKPLTNGRHVIPPPIYIRPPPLHKKRGQAIEYSRIPRVLTHDRQERSPYGDNLYRAVLIDHLAPGTTLADLTTAIARTAPVGPVTSAALLPAPRLGAQVVFGRHQAASALIRAARAGTFRVRASASASASAPGQEGTAAATEVVPKVSRDKSVAHHWNNARRIDSRVVLVRGRPGEAGFSEDGVRAAMLADADALAKAGPLGAECEPVVVAHPVDDEGCVTLEWRFFSARQAAAMRLAVERRFGERVHVCRGHDPCWVDEANGVVPERLNREQAWRHE